ncbi:MAG TPA: MerR family transcriptional regulator [Rectinemataceae bacterium]
MKGRSIGEAEALLGLPASTLRFWEKEVAFLSPRKDLFGRRVYSDLDLCLLSRLKHLALERGMGLGAAARLMEEDFIKADSSLKAELTALRAELIRLRAELLAARVAEPIPRQSEGSGELRPEGETRG